MRLGRTPQIRRAFDKQAVLLLQNLHHPSRRAKKYDESRGIWQARVNDDWRFSPIQCLHRTLSYLPASDFDHSTTFPPRRSIPASTSPTLA